MVGQAGATLTGHAIPTVAIALWDHTYVTSSCGLIWPCLGNATIRNPICSGIGDSSIADCLSQPVGNAGIRYLVNGVCHQISNRILHPASVIVSRASGYRLSAFRYGPYGKNLPSPALSACYLASNKTVPVGYKPSGSDMSFLSHSSAEAAERLVLSEVKALDKHPNRVEELRSLVSSVPNSFIDADTFARLSEIQGRLWDAEDKATDMFQGGFISPEQFYDVTMFETRVAMDESRRLLGDQFFIFFGEAALTPECMMSREDFIAMNTMSHSGGRYDSIS